MLYYVGDVPSEDIVIDPARNGEPIILDPFDQVEITLWDGSGIQVVTSGFLGSIVGDQVIIEWPGDTPFAAAGLFTLHTVLASSTGPQRERLAPVYLIVQDDDGWHTLDTARDEWIDARSADDMRLYVALTIARQQVTSYAPALTDEQRPPLNYRQGQLMQARNIWNASKVDPSGGLGEGDFVVRPFPLDWMIKQVLRPKTAMPAVG